MLHKCKMTILDKKLYPELQEAYCGVTSLNSAMSGDFPNLLPGNNAVSWTGNVTKVDIQPNWRYL